MLITTCAHCRARFRVSPQQLNARQGQVRCGRCEKVFSGFEALERFPDDDTGGRLLAASDDQHVATGTVDFEVLPDGPMPEIETINPQLPPIQLEQSPPATSAGSRRPAPAAEITLEPVPRKPISRAWSFGVALLAVALALELTYAFRGPLAQRYPALRPGLESVCARLECNVPWAREEGMLKLEDSELLEVPGKPTEIALGARIRNLASVAQEYPHLELTLTDLTGQAALRRVLRPTDYLGRPLAQGEVLPAGVEIALQLRLETPRIKATGYELLLFYP